MNWCGEGYDRFPFFTYIFIYNFKIPSSSILFLSFDTRETWWPQNCYGKYQSSHKASYYAYNYYKNHTSFLFGWYGMTFYWRSWANGNAVEFINLVTQTTFLRSKLCPKRYVIQGNKICRNIWRHCNIIVMNLPICSWLWILVVTRPHHSQMHFYFATITRSIESSLTNTESLILFNYVNPIILVEPILQRDQT